MRVHLPAWRLPGIAIAMALCLVACLPTTTPSPAVTPTPEPAPIRRVTVLYTNDEHGWLAAQTGNAGGTTGGAAELAGRWQSQEGYQAGGPVVLLSGGDMWTGPAISSWFNGDSAAEVMNLMGYRAAAIGNHEFDFGVDVLRRHAHESVFPYLSANLVSSETGTTPDFAKPFTIIDAGGVRIGLIGLTTTLTPWITNPRHFAGFTVLPYADALARTVPQVEAAGADMIIALAHVCAAEMRTLAPQAAELGVDVLTAGHCHEQVAEEVNGLPLLGGGQNMRSYARLVADVDVQNNKLTSQRVDLVLNAAAKGQAIQDAAVAERVSFWQQQVNVALGEVIGYSKTGLADRSDALFNLVTDAWLWAYDAADVAITNRGGFRQGIQAGPITLADVVGILPFNDELVEVNVTGAQLKANLDCCGGVIGGITYLNGKLVQSGGAPIEPQKSYRVLINDFMAGGGDGFKFGQQDPGAYFTAIDWRQPVIDYVKSLGTSESDPLENHLDKTVRKTP